VDFLSVGGIILAFASVLLCMVIDGGSLMSLVQESAALIVFGGTAGAVLLQTPFSTFMRSVKMTLWVFMPPVGTTEDYIDLLAAVEDTASALAMPVLIEGYPPPPDSQKPASQAQKPMMIHFVKSNGWKSIRLTRV